MNPLTVPVGSAKPGETAPFRKADYKQAATVRPFDSKAELIPEFITECLERNPSDKAVAWRRLVEVFDEKKTIKKVVNGETKETEKTWQFYQLSSYESITRKDLLKLIKVYSNGLVNIGLKPKGENKMHIYASSSHKWMQTFLASSFQGIPIVTAYDTLGEEGLTSSLTQTESDAIFTDNNLLNTLIRPLQKATSVKYIIHTETIDSSDKRWNGKLYKDALKAKEEILKVRPDIKFFTYQEVIDLGKDNTAVDFSGMKSDDTACIMFTSGSTGTPKGVVISHGNIIAAVSGISSIVPRAIVGRADRVIAFLPLAHIFEMVMELTNFWWGSTLGYANVKTLTDASVRNCESDLSEFKPTVMVGVAAVWESVRKGVLAELGKQPLLVQKIFAAAVRSKAFMKHWHLPGYGVFDLLFKKVRVKTGGCVRYVMNGGSAISHDTQEFISNVIAPMLLGYGLTETCAAATLLDYRNFEYDVVGTLVSSVTGKLVDVEDAGYFAKNNQGELLMQGASITKGYYENEKETKEAYTEDGWFRTGDIAEIMPNGTLKIIDRKKNLVKTLNGEYIALEKLESVYRSNSIAANICVYADQNQVKPVGIIVPNENYLRSFVQSQGIYSDADSKDYESLLTDKKVLSAVLSSFLETGTAGNLKGIELIQNVVLVEEEWTPQNGYVTSAMKLQRKKIFEQNKKAITDAYK